MLNINPTNSSKIAQSVQRDYQQAAQNHRLTKETNHQTNVAKISLTLTTLITAVAFISQYLV